MPPPKNFLRHLVRDYSLKPKNSYEHVTHVDVDRFGREIDVGK